MQPDSTQIAQTENGSVKTPDWSVVLGLIPLRPVHHLVLRLPWWPWAVTDNIGGLPWRYVKMRRTYDSPTVRGGLHWRTVITVKAKQLFFYVTTRGEGRDLEKP